MASTQNKYPKTIVEPVIPMVIIHIIKLAIASAQDCIELNCLQLLFIHQIVAEKKVMPILINLQ